MPYTAEKALLPEAYACDNADFMSKAKSFMKGQKIEVGKNLFLIFYCCIYIYTIDLLIERYYNIINPSDWEVKQQGKTMTVRLKDIAEKAGINAGSVSQVLNNHPKAQELRPETRERILKIANNLGYHRNELARSVSTGSSNVIAFICSDMGAIEYTGRIQKSVFDTASKMNYSVSFYQLTADNQKEIIRKILEWKITGIIFHTNVEERQLIMEAALKHNIQVGIINHTSDNSRCIGATSDDFQGAVTAVKHLAGLGHRKIAYATISGESEYLNNRHGGYLEGMKMFAPGQKPQIVKIKSNNYDSWCSAIKISELLNAPESECPSAVFCAMDSLAMAFCRAAYIKGWRVPEDFSVVGFGNLDFAKYSIIPLTTIAQPFEEMSQVVTEKVINAIKNKKSEAINVKLNAELVIRSSTATFSQLKHQQKGDGELISQTSFQ